MTYRFPFEFVLKVTNTHTAGCTTNKSPKSCPLDSRTTEKCTYYRNESVQMLSTTVKESTIENLNDDVMLDYVIFADENFSLPIQKKSTLYYFIHCRFIS